MFERTVSHLASGRSFEEVEAELEAIFAMDDGYANSRGGQLSCWSQAPTATGRGSLAEQAARAAATFAGKSLFYENTLPSLRHLREAVLAMTAELAGMSAPWHGTITMGGTESNLLATLAAREEAAGRHRVQTPNIVIPMTGHPSYAKAAHLFGLEVRRAQIGSGFRAPSSAIEELVDDSTILIAASAPDYCYGIYDDLTALGALAEERQIWLHVDAAVGGTITHLLREQGEDVPSLDVNAPGIRSVSADLHKHLYAPMGIGVLFCRNPEDASLHGYDEAVWPAGRMVSPVINGGRSSAPLAGAYAILSCLGRAGLDDNVRLMRQRRDELLAAIASAGAEPFGTPRATVVGFSWPEVDSARVASALALRGWRLSRLDRPAGLHAIVDAFRDDGLMDAFAEALRESVNDAKSDKPLPELPPVAYG